MSIRHIVLFKFLPGVTQENINVWRELTLNLQKDIPVVKKLEMGDEILTLGVSSGYDRGFIMHFDSLSDLRDVYQPHPKHRIYQQAVGPFIQGALDFDFEA